MGVLIIEKAYCCETIQILGNEKASVTVQTELLMLSVATFGSIYRQ